MPLPALVVTSGEPAGVGPDLCLALGERDFACRLACLCDPAFLAERARDIGSRVVIETVDEAPEHRAGRLAVLTVPLPKRVETARLDPANAPYVIAQLKRAVDGCVSAEFDAMVTSPVQKSLLAEAGVPFMGHTEYLAELTGAAHPVMLLVSGKLRVALATTHLPLSAVPAAITEQLLLDTLGVLDQGLRSRFGLERARIAVCGLNPHAGEGGHLGLEERDVIAPAIARARANGLAVRGPLPADTAFTPRALADCDAVLALYHDQGLPVLKYASFGHAVNLTLGIPILRTSVDHGTALDLAGTGRADPGSLIAAVELALDCARR